MSEFVEVKTADLVGAALDWAVAKAEISPTEIPPNDIWRKYCDPYSPSTEWKYGGPLIDKFRVSIIYSDEVCDPCAWTDSSAAWHAPTPLIAACRAIVASVLGDTVNVPKELLS